jgi:hypothetical protein
MCAIGSRLNVFETAFTMPTEMSLLHSSYFLLEVVKVLAGGMLLNWCWREQLK